jgi:hypothetical protein
VGHGTASSCLNVATRAHSLLDGEQDSSGDNVRVLSCCEASRPPTPTPVLEGSRVYPKGCVRTVPELVDERASVKGGEKSRRSFTNKLLVMKLG